MKFNKKVIALLLALSIVLSVVIPISLTTSGDTVAPVGVKFNLRAVNLLSGESTLTANSQLTIQYTDATLGDSMKMYATIAKADGSMVLDSAEVTGADLTIINGQTIHGANEEIGWIETSTTDCNNNVTWSKTSEANSGKVTMKQNNIYSNTAGATTFVPGAAVAGLNVADLRITIWTENKATGEISSKATTTINNGFTNGTPNGLTSKNWMNYIDGSTLLPQINLPGTHDAGALEFSTLENYNRCQDLTIAEQLAIGVRYLDIRGFGEEEPTARTDIPSITDFSICHAGYKAYEDNACNNPLTFYDVYSQITTFLKANPSETVILAISDDGDLGDYVDGARDKIMSAIASFVAYDPTLWYTKGTEIPTLDDVRGKIVLVRRMVNNHVRTDHMGMDFYWIDGEGENTTYPHAIVPKSQAFGLTETISGNTKTLTGDPNRKVVTLYYVQDNYRSSASEKWEYVTDYLGKSEQGNKKANQYWLNFLSAAGSTSTQPSSIASTVNNNFNGRNLTKGIQYGYLMFDFVEEWMCQKVYNTNIFLSKPQLEIDANGQIVSDRNDKRVVHYSFEKIENNKVANTDNNGFDGTLVNTSLVEHNSIYDFITLNNSGKNYADAGYVNIQQGVFAGSSETATIQVWMKAKAKARATTLFGMGSYNVMAAITEFDGQTARFAMGTQKTVYEGSGGSTFASRDPWPVNEWQLFTYVLDQGTLKVYKNGVLMTLSEADGTNKMQANFSDINGGIAFDDSFCLGTAAYSGWSDPGFNGSIGDFAIYNYALTSDEVLDNYEALANEYTYILEASMGASTAVASTTPLENYINEAYSDNGSAIYLTVPFNYDLTKANLSLKYDGSKVEVSNNGGSSYVDYTGAAMDLSGNNNILKVTSLDGKRVKYYTLNITVGNKDSLLLHYDFENVTDSVVKDVTGNGYDGSVNDNGVTVNNSSITLDGGNGHIAVDSQAIVDTAKEFTISMFVKPNAISIGNICTLISYGSNDRNRLVVLGSFGSSRSPRWSIMANDVLKDVDYNGPVLVAGEWTQVTFVQSNDTLKLYMNNVLVDTVTGVTPVPSEIGNTNFWLGDATDNVYSTDAGFNGEFGDFRIYSTALSEDEIYDLYRENYLENNVTLDASKIQLESFYDWNKDEKEETDDVNTQLKLEYKDKTGTNQLAGTKGGGTFYYKNVDFGTDGMNQATVTFFGSTGVVSTDTQVALYVDSISDSNLIGTITLEPIEGDYDWDTLQTATASLNQLVVGTHDLYYVITGNDDKMSLATHDDLTFSYVANNGITVKDYETDELLGAYYPENGTLSLSTVEKDGYLILNWYNAAKTQIITSAASGDTVYMEGVKIEAPENSGKSIRVATDGTNGLRFKASINRGDFYHYFNEAGVEYVYDENASYTFGMLIIPEKLLGDNELTLSTAKVLNIVGKNVYTQGVDTGVLEYTGVVTGIPESQYALDLVARAYATYTFEGETYTIYFDETEVGSYKGVAIQVYNDDEISSEIKAGLDKIFGEGALAY